MTQNWLGKSIGGRYQVDSLLGQGGMSAVYRATDPNLRRKVAIKLIHPHLSVDPNFIYRFKEEAAAVARLRHPHIVQVHDFDHDGDTYYMVMEYLVGETLQARLKRLNEAQRHMPYQDAIRICTMLSKAIGYAHNHEMIHRDIKPANIMLDLHDQPILMDFGIVKIIGGDFHTASGATVGTAMYMSPEQIRSERVDERSDGYSLGVTLYEMISGRTPYQADSAYTLMMMVLHDPLPDIRELRSGIPQALSSIIAKALAKAPADRFQSMEDMTTAFQRAEEEIGIVGSGGAQSRYGAAEDPVEPEVREPPARQESAVGSPRSTLHMSEQQFSAVPTEKEKQVAPIPASRRAFLSRLQDQVRKHKRRILIASALLLVLAAAAAAGTIYLQSQQAPMLQIAPVEQPSSSLTAETAPFVVSLGRWETSSYIEELAYSPEGKQIGTAHNRDVMQFAKFHYYGGLWDITNGSLQHYLPGHTQWLYSVAFSPDGQYLATASDDDFMILWQTSDGELARTIEASSSGMTSVDFSPNNLLLAAGSWDGTVGLWSMSDGHLLRTLNGHENSVRDIAFSPDGELIASASDDHTIRLWRVSDGSLVHILRNHTASVLELAFSPDGNWLASASEDFTLGLWQVSDGILLRSLQGHSEAVFDVAFSEDGSLLASGSGDGTLRLWRASNGELIQLLTEDSGGVTSLAFSSDSHLLVSSSSDGVLQFWGLSEAILIGTESP